MHTRVALVLIASLFGQESLTLRGHTGIVWSVSFSPDGKRIASGGDDNTVKVRNAASCQETRTFKGHTRDVLSVTFSGDGKRIASGSADTTIKIWDATSGQETRTRTRTRTLTLTLTHKGEASIVSRVAFSRDGKRLASGNWDGAVYVWDVSRSTE